MLFLGVWFLIMAYPESSSIYELVFAAHCQPEGGRMVTVRALDTGAETARPGAGGGLEHGATITRRVQNYLYKPARLTAVREIETRRIPTWSYDNPTVYRTIDTNHWLVSQRLEK